MDLKQKSEFAALCSFIHHFGADLGIYLTFPQLTEFLNLNEDVNLKNWETLHIKLLNKLKYRARPERWEPVLGRFLQLHAYGLDGFLEVATLLQRRSINALAVKPEGTSHLVYYGLDSLTRTKILLSLLETQFERNQGFKDKVNVRPAIDLRFHSLGTDVWGRIYWLLKDSEINVLLYREDLENSQDIKLLCETTNEIRQLHADLKDACNPDIPLSDLLKQQVSFDGKSASPKPPDVHMACMVRDDIASTESARVDEILGQMVKVSSSLEPEKTTASLSDDSMKPEKEVVVDVKTDKCEAEVAIDVETDKCKAEVVIDVETDKCEAEVAIDVETDKCEAEVAIDAETDKCKAEVVIDVKTDKCEAEVVTDVKTDECEAEVKPRSPLNEEANPPPMNSPDKLEPSNEVEKSPIFIKQETYSSPVRNGLLTDELPKTPSSEVRRSGRQRKPVEFLTMEPIQSKRIRTPKPTAIVDPPVELTDPSPKKLKTKHRKKQTPEVPVLEKIEVPVEVIKHENKKKRNKKKKGRRGNTHKSATKTWATHSTSSSSDSPDDADDTFERALLEHVLPGSSDSDYDLQQSKKKGKQSNCLDFVDKPESDFDYLSEISCTSSNAGGRNLARQKRIRQRSLTVADTDSLLNGTAQKTVEEECQICHKSHDPEWILLCDRCDLGHHAMCLQPVLHIIPDGDWFCPRCQHMTLLAALIECADAMDSERKKQTLFKRMQDRLNFVNISMTNILADGDDEDEGERKAARARKAAASSRQNRQRDAGVDYVESGSMYDSNEYDSNSSANNKRNRRTSTRPRRATRPLGRRSNGPRSRRNRAFSDDDESGTESSGSSSHSSAHAPRATRRRETHYNITDAFKQLDEALEDDLKYKEEKMKRKTRKQSNRNASSGDEEEEVPVGSDTSQPPPGQSRGKDLSNILGPNWKNTPKQQRRRRQMSSSSEDQEDSKNEHKRRDADFQPSANESSEDASDQSEAVSEEPVSSDGSWLCASRRAIKSQKSTRSRPRHGTPWSRKRGRPIPRFEQSDEDTDEDSDRNGRNRPRRSVAKTVITYNESEDDDGSDAPAIKRHPAKRSRLQSSDEEAVLSQPSEDEESSGSQSPERTTSNVGKRVRRISSSDDDDIDDPPAANGAQASSELSNLPGDKQNGIHSDADSNEADKIEHISSPVHEEESPDERLAICEASPEPTTDKGIDVVPLKTITNPNDSNINGADSDEAVEDEADNLLPFRLSTCYTATTYDTIPPALAVETSCSPDLFG